MEDEKITNDPEKSRPKFYLDTTTPAQEKTKQEIQKFFKIVTIPVLIAAFVQAASFYNENTTIIIWVANIAIFFYLGFLVKYKYHGSTKLIINYAIFVGLFLGLFVGLIKIISEYKFFLIFNLITEPTLFAVIGILISGLIGLIPAKKDKINN